MATDYPGAIDTYTNPAPGDPMNAPSHAGQHANANDAVEAIETELGTPVRFRGHGEGASGRPLAENRPVEDIEPVDG